MQLTVNHRISISRGLPDLLHLRLPDQHLRQPPLRRRHLHLQLRYSDVYDNLLLQ